MSADDALLDDCVLRTRPFHANGLHHAAACGGAIARMNINMLRPQTFRTVIGVAGTRDLVAAVFTNEILNSSLETNTRVAG